MRRGAGNYCLIDHGHILTGDTWTLADLDPEMRSPSRLLGLLGEEAKKLPFGHAVQVAFEAQCTKFDNALERVSPWLHDLFDKAERASVEHFLRSRASPSAGRKRRGLFI